MNDEQKELLDNIFNRVKDLDTINAVKRILKANDINDPYAAEIIAKWEGRPTSESIYPAKKLVTENKAIEEAPVVKDADPEPVLIEEPEVEEDYSAPVATAAPAPKFGR